MSDSEPERGCREVRWDLNRAVKALERIALMPCEKLNGGECPDYWAIGISKEACASCEARSALDSLKRKP